MHHYDSQGNFVGDEHTPSRADVGKSPSPTDDMDGRIMGNQIPKGSNPKFHRLHYNFVAKRLREEYDTSRDTDSGVAKVIRLSHNATLHDLAMSFARSFAKDNPQFDPLRFLDACSPDPELYPFSEMWEDGES